MRLFLIQMMMMQVRTQAQASKWLKAAETLNSLGGLTRKIVKRNVMTWAYSSRQ